MEHRHRGFGGGEEEHHHHPHFFHRSPPEDDPAYAAERYPPFTGNPLENPHVHHSHAHAFPHTHSPPGPYDTHASSGPYYPHPRDPTPPHAIYPPHHEPAQYAARELLPQGQIVRVFCKADPAFNLAVEHDTVIMKPANSQDEAQQWIKDSTYGVHVKDNYGYPALSLVNKKTRKILKHSKQKGQQVLLMDYRPDIKDDDILWSESQDFGEGFKTVRSASDTLLNLTVFEGTKKIRNGSALVLDTWHKGDHQLWKLFPL